MSEMIDQAINNAAWHLATQKEDALREVARERLPRLLRKAPDHPRILGALYHLRPSWRPVITYGTDPAGPCGVAVTRKLDGTVVIVETFGVRR